MIEVMSDVQEQNPKGKCQARVSGGMPISFTSPAETFHVCSTDISVIPKKSMSYYAQYLLSGPVGYLERGTASQLASWPCVK